MAQAVDRQLTRRPSSRPPGREPLVHRAGRDPPPALGQPRVPGRHRPIPGPHVTQILRQRLSGPRHHRGHRPTARRAAPHRLAVPDMAHPSAAQLRRRRARREVGHVQHRRLAAAQPPPVDHLEQRRVAERRQPSLAPRPRRPLRLVIGGVEERLQLGPGQRPPLWPPLILRGVHRRVALMKYLYRHRAGPLLALGHPAIPRVARILQEQHQRPLVGADRRVRPPARGHPRLCLRRRPLPRPAAGERGELADQALPLADQPRRSAAGPAAGAASPPASPPAAPPPARPAPPPSAATSASVPRRAPTTGPLPAGTRCINQPPSATDLDATSCHPAQPGTGNPVTTACPAPATRRQAARQESRSPYGAVLTPSGE